MRNTHLKRLMSACMCAAMLIAAGGMGAVGLRLIASAEAETPAQISDMPATLGTSISVKAVDESEYTKLIEEDEHDQSFDVGDAIKIKIANIKIHDIEKKEAPRVLIYHTHSYEAYAQDEAAPYKLASGALWRTEDASKNIMRVGERLRELLEGYGFQVVHDRTEFEPPRLGTAYVRSLEMLQNRLENSEEYDMIIDMHRDAYSKSSWTPASLTLDESDTARLMFLVGTGEDGFTEKPLWEENYALANTMVQYLQAIDPQLCKDVNVKTQRYNQHVSTKCVLVEVGHCENTLDAALISVEYLAQAINHALKSPSDGE